VGGFQLAISRYSQAVDAAIEWVRYATSPEVQAYHAVLGALTPTIPAVAAQPDVLQALPFLKRVQDMTVLVDPAPERAQSTRRNSWRHNP
jgi:trehalose/maltose transport system substrate-binding protein